MNIFRKTKGFTIIELIVVIAIIGILVLLAAPRFLGYTQNAQLVRIRHDVKTAENYADEILIVNDNKLPQHWTSVGDNQLNQFANEGKLYDITGIIVDENEIEEGEYFLIKDNGFKSRLKGNFYTNIGGKVYYEDIKSGYVDNGGSDNTPDEPTDEDLNMQDDFQWVKNQWFGYEAINEEGKGYYKYIGADEVVTIPHIIKGNPMTSYYQMFEEGNENIKKVISTNKNITSMNSMFDSKKGDKLDISELNTSNVITMNNMFTNVEAISLDLRNLDTSSVKDMSWMFNYTKSTSVNLLGLDTSNVETMEGMFRNASMKTIDLTGLDTSNVTHMGQIFCQAKATEIIGFETLNTENVELMYDLFSYSNILSIDLSNLNTSSAITFSGMFEEISMPVIDVSSFDLSNATNTTQMFKNSELDKIIGLEKWDTSSVIYMQYMFEYTKIPELNLSNFNTSNVESMNEMFYNAKIPTLDLSNFDLMPNVSITRMFEKTEATLGYAKTQNYADMFNDSITGKPATLTFVVK